MPLSVTAALLICVWAGGSERDGAEPKRAAERSLQRTHTHTHTQGGGEGECDSWGQSALRLNLAPALSLTLQGPVRYRRRWQARCCSAGGPDSSL